MSNYLIIERYGYAMDIQVDLGLPINIKSEYKMCSPTPHMLIRTLLQKCIFACNRSPYFM